MVLRWQALTVTRRRREVSEKAEVLCPAQCRLGHEPPGLSGVPTLAKRDFLGALFDQIRDAVQDRLALGPIHRGPCRESGLGGARGGVDIGGSAQRHLRNQAFIHRRAGFKRAARPRQTFPSDQVQNAVPAKPHQMAIKSGKMGGKIGHRISPGR